jgi:hypothetical protein
VQKDVISLQMTHILTKQFVDKPELCQLHSTTTTTFATMFSSGKLAFAYLAQQYSYLVLTKDCDYLRTTILYFWTEGYKTMLDFEFFVRQSFVQPKCIAPNMDIRLWDFGWFQFAFESFT